MVDVVVTGFDIGREVGTVFMGVFWGYLFLLSFDVLTGLIASAVQGKLNSNISFQGMMKKVASIVALAFVSFVDVYFKLNGTIVAIGLGLLVSYEGISIIENLGRSGINVGFLRRFFDENKIGDGGNDIEKRK